VISITLFDAERTQPQTYTQPVVVWGTLKRAIRMAKRLEAGAPDTQLELAGLVVWVFRDRFTVDDLAECTDLAEQIAVINQITQTAVALLPQGSASGTDEPGEALAPADDWMARLDRNMVKQYGWSLRDLDETDIESLFPFLQAVTGSTGAPVQTYCDQVGWL